MRPTRNAHAQHPHDLFTTASLLWPIVAGMQINEATVVHPITANVLAMSSGRLGAVVAAVVGLTGIVIGGRALARSAVPDPQVVVATGEEGPWPRCWG